jgi:integrase
MSVRRDSKGKWFYRKRLVLPDGSRQDVYGYPTLNTKLEAERAERDAIQHALDVFRNPHSAKEVPTFAEWHDGRYWREHVVTNKPGTIDQKQKAYDARIKKAFGHLKLNQIGVTEMNEFRASLIADKLEKKTINNLLAIVSKPLKYAVEAGVLVDCPRVGMLKVERGEVGAWELDEYAAILRAAEVEGDDWYAVACLCGEAGLRIGEARALKWSDIDVKAGTITISRQRRHEVEGTTKGGTRRTVPLTATLRAALAKLGGKTGYVIRNADGSPKTDDQCVRPINRIYRNAKVPDRDGRWHLLRHSFGAHAAMFGVNPWTLQRWMGHKRIDETMLYVNFASDHQRTIPAHVLLATASETNPDKRITVMLGARCCYVAVVSDRQPGSEAVAHA